MLHPSLRYASPPGVYRDIKRPTTTWDLGVALDVFPNPANGPVFAAYTVPEGMDGAELRVMDVHGRVLEQLRVGMGAGLHTLATQRLSAGMYLVELRLTGRSLQQAKLVVQP